MYRYTGINPAGFQIRGELLAASVEATDAELLGINVVPLRCRVVSRQRIEPVLPSTPGLDVLRHCLCRWVVGAELSRESSHHALEVFNLPTRQLQVFTEDLAHLLHAGLPLNSALEQIQHTARTSILANFASRLHQLVTEGCRFSEALQKLRGSVPEEYANVIEVAETRGELASELSRLAALMQARAQFRRRLRRAISYPLLVLCLLALLVAFLVSVVIPSLAAFMQELDQVMPWHTQALIRVCEALRTHGAWIVLFLLLLGVLFTLVRRLSQQFRLFSDGCVLRIPVIGPLLMDWHATRFSRDLAALCESGIDLLAALRIVEPVTANHYLWANTRVIRLQVEDGVGLAGAMRSSGLFAQDCLQLMRLAEVSGRYIDALQQVQKLTAQRLVARVDRIERSVGPLMMVVTGLLILWIIVSVIEPIYSSAINAGGML